MPPHSQPRQTRPAPLDIPVRELGDADDDVDSVRGLVAAGVLDGIRAALSDQELTAKFWRTGYESLTEHAGRASSQWVGSRILTAAVIAVVSAGVAWLVNHGKI